MREISIRENCRGAGGGGAKTKEQNVWGGKRIKQDKSLSEGPNRGGGKGGGVENMVERS